MRRSVPPVEPAGVSTRPSSEPAVPANPLHPPASPDATSARPAKKASAGLPRVVGYDGLRGFAILFVLAGHAELPYSRGAAVAVDLFFLLSGFLITTLLLKEIERTGGINLRAFYMRRVLRLAPALLFLLAVYTGYCLVFSDQLAKDLGEVPLVLFYAVNWASAFDWSNKPVFLAHTWSLSVEEQFYVLWPLALIFMERKLRSRWHIVYVTVAVAAASWTWRVVLLKTGSGLPRVYHGTDARGDALLLGCALSMMLSVAPRVRKWLAEHRALVSAAGTFGMLCFVAFCMFTDFHSYRAQTYGLLGMEIIMLGVFVDLAEQPPRLMQRLLSNSVLVWFGTVSYGLYLWHFLVYEVMRAHGAEPWQVAVFGMPISLAITAFSFYAIELPALRLKRHFQPLAQSANKRKVAEIVGEPVAVRSTERPG